MVKKYFIEMIWPRYLSLLMYYCYLMISGNILKNLVSWVNVLLLFILVPFASNDNFDSRREKAKRLQSIKAENKSEGLDFPSCNMPTKLLDRSVSKVDIVVADITEVTHRIELDKLVHLYSACLSGKKKQEYSDAS